MSPHNRKYLAAEILGMLMLFAVCIFVASLQSDLISLRKLRSLPLVKAPSDIQKEITTTLTIIQGEGGSILDEEFAKKLKNEWNLDFTVKIIKAGDSEAEKIIRDNQLSYLPVAFFDKNIQRLTQLDIHSTTLAEKNKNWFVPLGNYGQQEFYFTGELPKIDESFAWLGKKEAAETAFIFGGFSGENDRKFYQEILPVLEPMIFDGRLKLYFINAQRISSDLEYQADMANKCTQKYDNRFIWDYLEKVSEKTFPLNYKDIVWAHRELDLSEYLLNHCVSGSKYAESLIREKQFTDQLGILQTPSLLIGRNIVMGEVTPEEVKNLLNIYSPSSVDENFWNEFLQDGGEISLTEPVLYSPEAKFTISLWGDFLSEESISMMQSLKTLYEKYDGTFDLTFRNLPITNKGRYYAQMGECAQAENRFWEFYGLAIENLSLAESTFSECRQNNNFSQEVESDLSEARALNFSAGPVMCINTNCTKGKISLEEIETQIANKITQTKTVAE